MMRVPLLVAKVLIIVLCLSDPSFAQKRAGRLQQEPQDDGERDQLPLTDNPEKREKRRPQSEQRTKERRHSRSQSSKNQQGTRQEQEYDFANFTRNMQVGLSLIYPVKPPRDVLEGLVAALKSALIGLTISAASFLSFPVCGYVGMKNIGGVLVGGIVGSIISFSVVVGSIGNGLYQLFLGTVKTPGALWSKFVLGKCWDKSRREWIQHNLQEEDQELQNRKTSSGSIRHKVYYDLLGVAPNATGKEIKKAYYQRARDVHPDKNPDDEQANEQFLRLYDAYSTLSDDNLRAAYDNYGTTSATGGGFDAKVFFAVLFDSESMEQFVGDLHVSFYFDKMLQLANLSKSGLTADSLQDFFFNSGDDPSRRREVEIAKNLLVFVQDSVDKKMPEEEFSVKCRQEAEKIADSTFGGDFLTMIGRSLLLNADSFVGYSSPLSLPAGFYTTGKNVMRDLNEKYNSWEKTLRFLAEVAKLANAENSKSKQPFSSKERTKMEMGPEQVKGLLPHALELAWTYIARDVRNTLNGACRRLFYDYSFSRKERLRRAEGLRVLGIAMLQVQGERCVDTEATAEEIERRLNQAYKLATRI